MEALQNRIDSFAKQKRVKNPSKTSSYVNVKWPHPSNFRASPEALAEAGFFFNPSFEDRDNVTCFACAKQLSEWEEGDDPFDIHWEKCGVKCCWASVRCGLRDDMDRQNR
jgi:Inhibitor of Apoptosis domain